MGVKVKLQNPGMTARRLVGAFERILPALAEIQLSDCNTYVRMQDGTLADSAHQEDGGRRIVWSTAYAKRVYYTGHPKKTVNPNASLRWCEKAKAAHKADWAAAASRMIEGD